MRTIVRLRIVWVALAAVAAAAFAFEVALLASAHPGVRYQAACADVPACLTELNDWISENAGANLTASACKPSGLPHRWACLVAVNLDGGPDSCFRVVYELTAVRRLPALDTTTPRKC